MKLKLPFEIEKLENSPHKRDLTRQFVKKERRNK